MTLREYIEELKQCGYIEYISIAGSFSITNKAIFEIENKYHDIFLEFMNFIKNLTLNHI